MFSSRCQARTSLSMLVKGVCLAFYRGSPYSLSESALCGGLAAARRTPMRSLKALFSRIRLTRRRVEEALREGAVTVMV